MSMVSVDRSRRCIDGLKLDVCLHASRFNFIFAFFAIFTDMRISNS